MNNLIKRVWNRRGMTHIEDLQGFAFSNESGGHTFQISGVEDGTMVVLSGTVAASFLRPDQATVAITGSISGGVVSVTLPANCYDIPGRFGLVIFLTSDSQKTAIYSCVGNVARSSTSQVAPGTTADVVDLINQIQAAVATIPQSWTGLMADIAPTYSASAVYPVGAYVYYNGDLYRCTTAITTAESWTAGHWTAAVLGNDLHDLKSAVNVVLSTLDTRNSDLTLGKYWSMTEGQTPTTVDGSSSLYTPTPIDISAFADSILRIEVSGGTPSGVRCFGFVDDDNVTVKRWVFANAPWVQSGSVYYIETPVLTNKFLFSCTNSLNIKLTARNTTKYMDDKIYDIASSINVAYADNDNLTLGKYWTMTDGQTPTTVDGSASLYTPKPLEMMAMDGFLLRIEVSGTAPSGIRCFGFVDNENKVVKHWTFAGATWTHEGDIYYFETPMVTKYFLFSCINTMSVKIKTIISGDVTAYTVSTSGNDSTGDGITTPFATVNRALDAGASLVLVQGGVYNQQIDLSKLKNRQLMIAKATHNARVVFRSPSLEITSASNVSGYTNVLSAAFSGTIDENCTYLWQENVPDARTEISDLDRHPLQRGQQYRLLDTKIEKCDATALSDALTEIENSQDYKWFFDSDNSVLYFNCPSAISGSYPVCGDVTKKTLFSSPALKSLKLIGIDSKYMAMDLTFGVSPELIDCKVSNCTCDGGYKYDRVVGAKFVRCEVCGVAYGTTGDGFNAHSWTSGDAYAKQTTCELVDCWAHDNNDDGYSDHERSEAIIRGGLYENNHKGGVTPAHGSHCVCYNVMSRYNSNGFFYIGAASTAEGGMYGQMMCFNCVSKGNGADENARGAGFRVSNGHNSMYLVNCHSIGDYNAYEAQDTTIAHLVNCTAQETTHDVKNGIGTFVIKNGSLVE